MPRAITPMYAAINPLYEIGMLRIDPRITEAIQEIIDTTPLTSTRGIRVLCRAFFWWQVICPGDHG